MDQGKQIVNTIPKQLPTKAYNDALNIAQSAVSTTTQTIVIVEILIAVVVAVSLK